MRRLLVLTALWLALTAATTFAAGDRLRSAPDAAPRALPTVSAPHLAAIVVPDVRRQVYVFAKGMLEDAGFAWRVQGKVRGYAANVVAEQEPAPGTRVLDTGAPTVRLRLARGSGPQRGEPEDASPFAGTKLRLADAPAPAAKAKPEPKPKRAPKPGPKPAKKAPRPPAFTGAGTRPEPQDELPLPVRADRLAAWFAGQPKPTDANVRHWLYQHHWLVSGARAGWWRGAAALRTLIDVDRRVERAWGIGARSEAAARRALAEVEARLR